MPGSVARGPMVGFAGWHRAKENVGLTCNVPAKRATWLKPIRGPESAESRSNFPGLAGRLTSGPPLAAAFPVPRWMTHLSLGTSGAVTHSPVIQLEDGR